MRVELTAAARGVGCSELLGGVHACNLGPHLTGLIRVIIPFS